MGGDQPGNYSCTYTESKNWNVGKYIFFTDLTMMEYSAIPKTGWGTSSNELSISSEYHKLDFTKDANWEVTKYYNLHYTTAPTNTSDKGASFFNSKSFTLNGSTKNVNSIVYSKNALKITTTDGIYTLGSSSYLPQYSFNFSVVSSVQGAYAKNLLPTDGTSSNIGGSGSDESGKSMRWGTVFCDTINAINTAPGSKRELKENIHLFDRSALDIVNGTEIVSFNYKEDQNKTPKIGFIADDTDESIAGRNHDLMDYTSCIGVLMKAVQELSERIKELESQH